MTLGKSRSQNNISEDLGFCIKWPVHEHTYPLEPANPLYFLSVTRPLMDPFWRQGPVCCKLLWNDYWSELDFSDKKEGGIYGIPKSTVHSSAPKFLDIKNKFD